MHCNNNVLGNVIILCTQTRIDGRIVLITWLCINWKSSLIWLFLMVAASPDLVLFLPVIIDSFRHFWCIGSFSSSLPSFIPSLRFHSIAIFFIWCDCCWCFFLFKFTHSIRFAIWNWANELRSSLKRLDLRVSLITFAFIYFLFLSHFVKPCCL